jgi:hypothetical protein
LAAELGLGHVGLDPKGIEDLGIDTVAELEDAIDTAGDAGQSEDADEGIGFIFRHQFTAADFPVEIEQPGDVHFAAQEALADEDQVIIAVAGLAGKEQFIREMIHE